MEVGCLNVLCINYGGSGTILLGELFVKVAF